MKKILFMVCLMAAIAPVAFAAKEKGIEITLDSAQIAYLESIDDNRFVDSVRVEQLGPHRRVKSVLEIPNSEDTTKIDSVEYTEKILKSYGCGVRITLGEDIIFNGRSYNKSIGENFTHREVLGIEIFGKSLGEGYRPLAHRLDFYVGGRIYFAEYSPRSTSFGKKYLTGAAEGYLGYDILGMDDATHVLSIGPLLGFEMQKMDTMLDRSQGMYLAHQSFNVYGGIRVQYTATLDRPGMVFTFGAACVYSQDHFVNETAGQIECRFSLGIGFYNSKVAKRETKKRNKAIEEVLNPKDN
jgi:hypothetical protein